jgi:hypothetical protein
VTEDLNRLEAELAAMRLRPVPAQVALRIAGDLGAGRRLSWPDRILAAAMSAGALAACVSAVLLLRRPDVPPPTTALLATTQPHAFSEYTFARADLRWSDLLKASVREKS